MQFKIESGSEIKTKSNEMYLVVELLEEGNTSRVRN
jgi:hypothetical protein